jgi:hypothetical protein
MSLLNMEPGAYRAALAVILFPLRDSVSHPTEVAALALLGQVNNSDA